MTPSGESKILAFSCLAADYRLTSFTLGMNSTNGSAVRVYVFNSTSFKEVINYLPVNGDISRSIRLIRQFFSPNGTGHCLVKIENIGNNKVQINSASMNAYLERKAKVIDIIPEINGIETYSLNNDDNLLNVTVEILNSYSQTISGTLWVNITDENNNVVNYTSFSVSLSPNSFINKTVENIDTSSWNGAYTIKAYLTYSSNESSLIETVVKSDLIYEARYVKYICPSTKEQVKILISHVYSNNVSYNLSLEVPSGWNYQPDYICLLYTSPSPRDLSTSRMPSSA